MELILNPSNNVLFNDRYIISTHWHGQPGSHHACAPPSMSLSSASSTTLHRAAWAIDQQHHFTLAEVIFFSAVLHEIASLPVPKSQLYSSHYHHLQLDSRPPSAYPQGKETSRSNRLAIKTDFSSCSLPPLPGPLRLTTHFHLPSRVPHTQAHRCHQGQWWHHHAAYHNRPAISSSPGRGWGHISPVPTLYASHVFNL